MPLVRRKNLYIYTNQYELVTYFIFFSFSKNSLIYWMQQEFFCPFLSFNRDLGRYFSRKVNCFAFMAPRLFLEQREIQNQYSIPEDLFDERLDFYSLMVFNYKVQNTYSLIRATASSYLSPSSMRATATRTGALPRPATQCTATHASGDSRNRFFNSSNHSSTTCILGINWAWKRIIYLFLSFNIEKYTWNPLPHLVEMYHRRIPNQSHWSPLTWVPQLCTLVRRLSPPPLHCASSVPEEETTIVQTIVSQNEYKSSGWISLHTNLNKSMDRLIIGPIGNEELHVFVFNLGGRRSDILHPHVAHCLLNHRDD